MSTGHSFFREGGVGGHRKYYDSATSAQMFEAIPVEVRRWFGWRL